MRTTLQITAFLPKSQFTAHYCLQRKRGPGFRRFSDCLLVLQWFGNTGHHSLILLQNVDLASWI